MNDTIHNPGREGAGPGRPRWIFPLITALLTLIAVGVILLLFRKPVSELAGRLFFQHAARYLPETLKEQFYRRLAGEVSGIYDPIPEPDVGRVMQAWVVKTDRQAEVVSNNAGMRDRRHYLPPSGEAYRIVCLGDSYIFGQGGKEEDRFSNQIEEILKRLGVTAEGKPIEVYSLGLPGWTAVNEATYLTSRLSAYSPDLIVVFLVGNDISDTYGVTGVGVITNSFSPERRRDGSGACFIYLSNLFGTLEQNFLTYDLGPQCRGRWEKAFAALKRLEELQNSRGKRMLVAVLDRPDFTPFVRYHYNQSRMESPLIVTNYLLEKGTLLDHDPHPNRRGHEILALHLLHSLGRLGWLEIDPDSLDPLSAGLSPNAAEPITPEEIEYWRRKVAGERLPEKIDFRRMRPSDLAAFLGGILPDRPSPRALEAPPWGSVKSALLLKRLPGAERIRVEIEVPPAVELYPFEITMFIDGQPATTLLLKEAEEAGVHLLEGELPKGGEAPAVEVVLETNSYLAGITDHRMRSYRWLNIEQE